MKEVIIYQTPPIFVEPLQKWISYGFCVKC